MLDLLVRNPEGADYQPATPARREPSPRYVAVVHHQHGIGTALTHAVEIRDSANRLLAAFPASWAARWLAERGYTYVTGSNGLWSQRMKGDWTTLGWSLPAKIEYHSMPEPNSGCWLWLSAVNRLGYGRIRWRRRDFMAHRASWLAYRGPIPKGLLVCHKCDVPSCVNPDHLWLGTQLANLADQVRKRRRLRRGASCR